MAGVNTGDNRWATSNFIVAPTLAQGAAYTSIAAAITAAGSAGDIFIKPGTYTESFSIPAGINLIGYKGDGLTAAVTIIGKITCSDAGNRSIANIRLQTNSDFFLVVSGSVATVVNLQNCYLNCTNNTGISFTSSSASSRILLNVCTGDITTTLITLFASSAAGIMIFNFCSISNSGSTLAANTISAGSLQINWSSLNNTTTSSGTAGVQILYSTINNAGINIVAFTSGGSGSHIFRFSLFASGTATALTITNTISVFDCNIVTSNTNATDGAGTLQYSNLTFEGTSSLLNTTTQTAFINRPGITRSAHQPAFLATSAGVTDVTGDNTVYTVVYANEIYDQGANFSSTTFTAPYTGKYYLAATISMGGLLSTHTRGAVGIITSNRSYNVGGMNVGAIRTDLNTATLGGSVLADMDAGDTATVTFTVFNSTKVVDVLSDNTTFSGVLIC